MELWEVEFTFGQIANAVSHKRTGVSGEGQFDDDTDGVEPIF